MKNVKVCPKCGSLVYFNSYFGAYICESCEWEDNSYAKKRNSYYSVYSYRENNCIPARIASRNK